MQGPIQRFAGQDPDIQGLVANSLAALAVGAPSLYGLVDLFTGPTHGANSGEIPLNFLISHIPLITGALGGLAGAAATPGAGLKTAPTDAEIIAGARRINSKLGPGLTAQEALETVNRAGLRRMGYGGLAGALAGGIPAIMMMRDQEQQPLPASAR